MKELILCPKILVVVEWKYGEYGEDFYDWLDKLIEEGSIELIKEER